MCGKMQCRVGVLGAGIFDDEYVDFQGGEGGASCCLWVLGQVKQMQFQGPV